MGGYRDGWVFTVRDGWRGCVCGGEWRNDWLEGCAQGFLLLLEA